MWLLQIGCRSLLRMLMLQRDRLRVVMLERWGWVVQSVLLRMRGRLLIPVGGLSVRLQSRMSVGASS